MFSIRRLFAALVFGSVAMALAGPAAAAGDRIVFKVKAEHKDTACIECHVNITPGIVRQHLSNKMGNPTNAADYVGCNDCHGDLHMEEDDYKLAEMPTPKTCAKCHKDQVEQFRRGKHNLAWHGMKTQPAWHTQPASLVKQGYRGCSGCHKLGEKGLIGIQQGNSGPLKRDGGKEASEYRYGNAQCDACHTRHNFSKVEAQNPRACSNCHMGFDHPQWEMWISSKHGIGYLSNANDKNHGGYPKCQTCHMNGGNHEVRTSWGFLGLRIPTKKNVLALIKVAPSLKGALEKLAAALPEGTFEDVDDDPQWTFDRAIILQAMGILDDGLQPTERFIDAVVQAEAARGPKQFNAERKRMKAICSNCHSKPYVKDFFVNVDDVLKNVDHLFAKGIQTVQALYKDGILAKPKNKKTGKDWKYAPDVLQYYDAPTHIEQELYHIMLEHRQRTFQGSFHVSNDYAHWYGWAPTNTAVNVIIEEAKKLRLEHALKEKLNKK